MTPRLRLLLGLILGLALLHTAHGAWASWLVEGELAALEDEGLLEHYDLVSSESAELAAARQQLGTLLDWVGEPHDGTDGRVSILNADVHEPATVTRLVAGRERFYEGLDALPAILWEVRGAPLDRAASERPRLMSLLASTNALDLKAWTSARDDGDGMAAGRVYARALAIARVTDDGSSSGFMLRWSTLTTVLAQVEKISAAGFAPRRDLLLPMEQELRAAEGSRRLAIMLGSDLRQLHDWERGLPESLQGWLSRPRIMGERLEFLERYRRGRQELPLESLLASDEFSLHSIPNDRPGDQVLALRTAPTLRIVGDEDGAWLVWQPIALQDEELRAQVSALLATL